MIREAKANRLPDGVLTVLGAAFAFVDILAEHAKELPEDVLNAALGFEAVLNEHCVIDEDA